MAHPTRLHRLVPLLIVTFCVLAPRLAHGTATQSWLHCGFEAGAYRYALFGASSLTGAFTIETWFRAGPQAHSPFPVLCQKPVGNMFNGEANYAFILTAETGRLTFRATTDAGTFNLETAQSLLDGQWHHVAGVRSTGPSARIFLYVDGTPAGSAAISGNALTSTEALGVGGVEFPGYVGNYFEGDIDELRLWNVARTPAEIFQDRAREVGSAPGLVGACHFNADYFEFSTPVYLGLGSSRFVGFPVPAGVVSLQTGAGSAPVARGDGVDLGSSFQAFSASGYPRAHYLQVVPRSGGVFVATVRQAESLNHRLQFGTATGSTVQLQGSIGIQEPIALTAQGTRAYVATSGAGVTSLTTYDAPNPNSPMQIGSPVVLDFLPRTLDVEYYGADRLWVLGTAPNAVNRIMVFDTTVPFAVKVDQELPDVNTVGLAFDMAPYGSWVAISYTDGFVRIYSVGFGPPGAVDLWSEVYVGGPAYLAKVPDEFSYDFLAATGNSVSVVNLTGTVVGAGTVEGGPVLGVAAVGTRAYVAVEGGLRVLDLNWGSYPLEEVAWYATDEFPNADPSFDPTTGRAYVPTGAGGLYGLTISSVVAVGDPAVPSRSLRAYPNPLRDRSTIALRLPKPGMASVELFDVAGRHVRRLAGGAFPAGENVMTWDGRDDAGNSVPAGIYFCRAFADGASETLRLVRLK